MNKWGILLMIVVAFFVGTVTGLGVAPNLIHQKYREVEEDKTSRALRAITASGYSWELEHRAISGKYMIRAWSYTNSEKYLSLKLTAPTAQEVAQKMANTVVTVGCQACKIFIDE